MVEDALEICSNSNLDHFAIVDGMAEGEGNSFLVTREVSVVEKLVGSFMFENQGKNSVMSLRLL